jgi:hypothetical protein
VERKIVGKHGAALVKKFQPNQVSVRVSWERSRRDMDDNGIKKTSRLLHSEEPRRCTNMGKEE